MKPTKSGSIAGDFLDAFANVIADRVATKLSEASKPPEPQMAPKWLPGLEKPARRRREIAPKGEDMRQRAERALRDSGFLTYGDAGYAEALKKHLDHRRARDVDVTRRAQLRRAVSLLEKILAGTANRASPRRKAKRQSSSG